MLSLIYSISVVWSSLAFPVSMQFAVAATFFFSAHRLSLRLPLVSSVSLEFSVISHKCSVVFLGYAFVSLTFRGLR